MVVVQDEPRVLGPGSEVLAEDLRQRLDVLGRRGKRPQMFAQTVIAVVDELRSGPCDSERQCGNIGRRRSGGEPDTHATVAYHPLLGECRLAVARRRDEHPHARLGVVEDREQPRPLDDPALADPCLGDCRRRRPLLTDVTWIDVRPYHPRGRRGARGSTGGHERPGVSGEAGPQANSGAPQTADPLP